MIKEKNGFVFCPIQLLMSLAVHSLLQYTNKKLLFRVYQDKKGKDSDGPASTESIIYEAFDLMN